MTREEIDILIRRCEQVSREHPRLYIARVVGLVLLAYGYLVLVLFGSLFLCLVMLGMILAAPGIIVLAGLGLSAGLGLFVAVLRGLWVRMQPPKGRTVTREQAPRLFALLDELRTELDCAPFHRVLIGGDLNASVNQTPRLGIFGWHRNYLLLGLPLMECLSPEEFRAVLAHEFAHSSRGHGRFGNWLYRVRRTWEQVFEQMARRRTRWGAVLTKFLDWFWPQFNGHAFVLARANEYVADACAVRLAGPEVAARMLVRLPINSLLLSEKFWPEVLGRAKEAEQPPTDVMAQLQAAVRRGPTDEDAIRWLHMALRLETNNADTHPCLKDRLRAMGCAALAPGDFALPQPIRESAAAHYLGEQAATFAGQLSEEWRLAVAPQWQARHAQARKLAEELAALEKPGDAPPGVPQLWEKACKLVDLHGDDAAVTVLEQLLALEPKHAGANYILGRQRLQHDDARGVEFMETAIVADPGLAGNGCQLLYAHFNRTGQRERLRPLEHRVDEFQRQTGFAQRERAHITAADSFIGHGLDSSQLEGLRKLLATEKDVGTAAVARKHVQYFPGRPCLVVALTLRVPWWKPRSVIASQKLAQRLAKAALLPGQFTFFVSERKLKALGAKVYAAPDAIIYRAAM